MEVGRKARAGQRNGGQQAFGIRPRQGRKGEQAERVQTGRGREGLTQDLGSATTRQQKKARPGAPLPVVSLWVVSVPYKPPRPQQMILLTNHHTVSIA